MDFLDRLAEQRIHEALKSGVLDNLPGAGQPIPEETDLCGVTPELRVAYRILKNSGFIPEQAQVRIEIDQVSQLLAQCEPDDDARPTLQRRYRLLLQKLGESRAGNLLVQADYLPAVNKTIDSV